MDPDKERENMKNVLRFLILAVIVLAGFCLMMTSCCVCKPLPEQTVIRDSVAVHIKDSLSVRDSVVFVQMPVENSQNILPETHRSKLETSLARSEAWVDSLGLHHTLENKAKPIEVHVPVTDHYTEVDTGHSETTTHTITQEVEREFTWWEKVRLRAFWWLAGAVLLLLVWTFRKPIIKLIGKV